MFNSKIESELRAMADRNWHIHTTYSTCARPEMTPERILAAVDRLGLKSVALVDHHHPGESQLVCNLASLASDVSRRAHQAKVIIGAELSAFGIAQYAESLADIQGIAYRLYACNHYHIQGWEHPDVPSTSPQSGKPAGRQGWPLPSAPRCGAKGPLVRQPTDGDVVIPMRLRDRNDMAPLAYKEHSLAVLRNLIPTGRAHCIAHPFLGSYLSAYIEDDRVMTRLFSDDELAELFGLARRHGVAWEISTRHLIHDVPFARRYLSVGFAAGADFRLGTDAHALGGIDPRPQVERLIKALKAKWGLF